MEKEKNLYLEMKERQQKEANELPIHFAFGDEQLKQKANLLGFNSIDEMIKNVSGIGGGGFCLKKDLQKVIDTFRSHNEEMEKYAEEHDIRICDECGHLMAEGYLVNGDEYYCTDECLHKHYSDDEYNELYDNGNSDDTYWTEWGE